MNANPLLRIASLVLFLAAALSAFSADVNWNELGLVAIASACWVAASLVGVVGR